MIYQMLAVGIGGALGAIGRYLLSLVPISSSFPYMTFLTNLIGAFVIGLIVGLPKEHALQPNWILFLKTGVCGGFTTFSTFSLESVTLLTQGEWNVGLIYISVSILLCLLGTFLGILCSQKLCQFIL